MGTSLLKFDKLRISGNNLSYEIFRGGGGGELRGTLSFYEIGLEVAFGLRYDLPWMRATSFPLTYLSQPVGL